MKSSVVALIFNPDKTQILLIKRRDVPIWVFPGGGVEPGETPDDALIRECKEETGLDVKAVRKIGEYSPVNRLANYTHVYECEAIGGSLSIGSETRNIAFYAIGNMPDSFFVVHREWLLDALQNQSSVIKRPISSVTYWALLKYFCKHPIKVVRFGLSRLGFPINS